MQPTLPRSRSSVFEKSAIQHQQYPRNFANEKAQIRKRTHLMGLVQIMTEETDRVPRRQQEP